MSDADNTAMAIPIRIPVYDVDESLTEPINK